MIKTFEFDAKVAVEAVLYIATKSQEPTFHHIAKLLYFADLLHIERYGRFICGDDYVAMKNGPVPSRVYDMLKVVKGGYESSSFPDIQGAFCVKGYTVYPQRDPDFEWLSESEIECLNEAIQSYDQYSFGQLTSMSHDAAWQSADENDFISLEAIVHRLGDPNYLLEHLTNSHP